MIPIIQVGPLAIQTPGLILLIGIWIGIVLAERNAYLFQITATVLYNLVLIMLIAGVLGARFSYILQFPEIFMQNPISIFSLNPGLMDLWGGCAVGIIAGLIYGKRKSLKFWPTLDALTPILAVFMVALALSHLASGSAYGAPAYYPWSIELWGERRHPTQVYEAVLASLVLFLSWPAGEKIQVRRPGEYFLNFVALTAGANIFLHGFRGDSIIISGGFRLQQIVAWFTLVLVFWMKHVIKITEGDIELKSASQSENIP